ncbi:MCE family protein [Umezawaea endophytica]|uniref:MCE family protein n=1 Tax=Umezawaea endophytica TaxID=1654476 RepID=A0A9X2ZYZ5_9PSEU|nr:MCE family protein [Umezawaea endophytica]MCS7475393.1 MCE family protein [Umezawaea endophytica]
MISRGTRVRLLVLVVIAVVGVTYTGAEYARLDRLFGARGYVATMRLTDSGGIFVNAEVAYRGVTVGRVTELRLTDWGVEVDLDVEPSAPPIPASTRALVANRSAIGEQYVELEPDDENGPFLGQGSVIPLDRTAIPPSPESVLANLDALVTSVPIESLRTVVDELDTAFSGAGEPLQRLLDSADSLTGTAIDHLPQTVGLLADGRTVLETQRAESANIAAFGEGLARISAQLKESDPDLRAVIGQAPVVARQVDDVLRTSGTDLSVLVANLLTTTQITTSRKDAIEQALVVYPIVVATTRTTSPDGTGHLGAVLNFFDPMSCTRGYETTHQRPADDVTSIPANSQAYCAEPPGSPISVRGAQNAPFAGIPQQLPAPEQQRQRLPGVLGSLDARPAPTSLAGLLGLGE